MKILLGRPAIVSLTSKKELLIIKDNFLAIQYANIFSSTIKCNFNLSSNCY